MYRIIILRLSILLEFLCHKINKEKRIINIDLIFCNYATYYFRSQISCSLYLDIEFCSKFIVRLCNTILLKINSMPCLVCYEIFEIFCRLLGNVWHVNISFQCVGPITTYIKNKIQSSLNIWPTIISIIIRRYHILTFWTYQ